MFTGRLESTSKHDLIDMFRCNDVKKYIIIHCVTEYYAVVFELTCVLKGVCIDSGITPVANCFYHFFHNQMRYRVQNEK